MIFLTIGTDLSFNRLVKAMDIWASNNSSIKVFAQIGPIGSIDYHPKHMNNKSMLSPEEYNQYCDEADFLIAHAGMGSIITALKIRKPIVLMPRLAKYGEHRNDHQVATTEKFMSRRGVFIASTEDDLELAITDAQTFSGHEEMDFFDEFAPKEFTDKLAQFIANT